MTEPLKVNSQQLIVDESSKNKSVDHSLLNGTVSQPSENQQGGNQNLDQSRNPQPLNDPVTKAVVDNIMGNLPTKKPFYRCDDCDLSFTSHAVLEAHLQGARHAKQIRTRTIMATLDESKIAFTKDAETNGLQCNVCNVCLNSLQQLHTHLNGNRHKKKALRGGWQSAESETEAMSGKPSSSQEVITGKLFYDKTPCKACKKTFDTLKLYKNHCKEKKHMEKMKLKKKDKRKRIFTDMHKAKSKANQRATRQTNFEAKQPLENYFVSSGYFQNGTPCEMSDDIF